MANRSMYCYGWDLAEAGVVAASDRMRDVHINTITLASAYHAGKFMRPQASGTKVYFPDDGTVYFKPRLERYGAIKPAENRLVAEHDVLAQCCDVAGMATQAWLVLLHNSRLGQLHPQAAVANAFGDRYIYSLCPSAPEVADYAVALCVDVTQSYPVAGITLETPGFLPFFHDYHHEFGMVRPNPWLDNLLGLCFCRHCVAGAQKAGIDAAEVQARVRTSVSAYLDADVDHAEDMGNAFWLAELALDTQLHAFMKWRCTVVEGLVGRIREAVRADATVSVIPSVARPTAGAWYEGSDINALAQVADYLEVCFYEPGVGRIRSDLFDVVRRCGGVKNLRGILRPGYPDLENRQSVIDAVGALKAGGISDIAFYNFGHMRRASVDWVGDALAASGLTQ
ncbi:MAG: hypothetical protein GXP01_10255 [Alphaproteobacteria bacterium]|nr:hypothetical protein [Alphaproteobacteria bacterium]